MKKLVENKKAKYFETKDKIQQKKVCRVGKFDENFKDEGKENVFRAFTDSLW